MTYIDSNGNWHRSSKGVPEQVSFHFLNLLDSLFFSLHTLIIHIMYIRIDLNQILTLCNCKEDFKKKVHSVINKFAERGLRSLAVARQVYIEKLGSF